MTKPFFVTSALLRRGAVGARTQKEHNRQAPMYSTCRWKPHSRYDSLPLTPHPRGLIAGVLW